RTLPRARKAHKGAQAKEYARASIPPLRSPIRLNGPCFRRFRGARGVLDRAVPFMLRPSCRARPFEKEREVAGGSETLLLDKLVCLRKRGGSETLLQRENKL